MRAGETERGGECVCMCERENGSGLSDSLILHVHFLLKASLLDGLWFELFSQELVDELLHHGRRDLLHVADVLGTSRHVQDGEQGRCLWEVGVVPQRVAHVVLEEGNNVASRRRETFQM